MVPTIRCRALEYISAVVLDGAHEARDSEESALIGDVIHRASGPQGTDTTCNELEGALQAVIALEPFRLGFGERTNAFQGCCSISHCTGGR